jgi:hypothetical protein
MRPISFNKCQGTTISKSEESAKLSQKVKDATAISKSEKSAQPFRKVEKRPNCHRSSTMGTALSEYQKQGDMSLICAILLNVTKTDDKR